MCDFVPGELLVAYQKDDPGGLALINRIREGEVNHVRVVDSLQERLTAMEIRVRADLQSEFWRLEVPTGEENFKANILQFLYRLELFNAAGDGRLENSSGSFLSDSRLAFAVVPNSILSTCFAFEQPRHDDYKALFGWKGPSQTTKKILIVDSGLLSTTGFNVTDERNFVDWNRKNDVTDDHPIEHGTAVAEIIRDLCPHACLAIFKVIDSKDRASEWDTLAALAVDCGADVINMSLAFGLQDQVCSYCGRESHSSRSAVFEKMLAEITSAQDVIVVGAAGNQGKTELAYPARFPQTVAIEAVNQAKDLAQFSNHGAVDSEGNPHDRVFVLPGGEKKLPAGSAATEWIGSAKGTSYCGTSFAAAYASSIFAHLWNEPPHQGKTSAQLIAHCAKHADKTLPKYSFSDHGHGLMTAL